MIRTQPLKGDGKVMVNVEGEGFAVTIELDIEQAEEAIESFTNSLEIVKRNLGLATW